MQVLDLDETLVHSSFKPIPGPDCIVPVEIEGRIVDVYVLKRPCLDQFMQNIGQRFEVSENGLDSFIYIFQQCALRLVLFPCLLPP